MHATKSVFHEFPIYIGLALDHDGLSAAHVPLLCRQSFIIFDLLNFFIMQRVVSMLYTLLAFAPLFVQSWRLIDNLDGNTWAQNTYFETVSSSSSHFCARMF